MSKRSFAIARAAVAIGSTIAIVTGVTFAQLSSSAILTANTLSSATADLKVSSGGPLAATDVGFAFSGLIPGSGYGVGHNFSLLNNGTAPLLATVNATVGAASGSFDKTKVTFQITNTTGVPVSKEYTFADLEGLAPNDLPGAPLTIGPGITKTFAIAAKIDVSALFSGTVSPFDLVFTGTAVPTP